MISAADRPRWVSEAWRKAERLAERRGRQTDAADELSRLQDIGMISGDEIGHRHLRGSPLRGQRVSCPSNPAVREIMGPAGKDMQMLPPMVAAFQILKEARKESQHSLSAAWARHSAGPANS
jgi:hypothetical protein